ncbi:lipoprotein [Streptomyces sp. NPDC014734]|uniref:lipoprotein n=1 Tax=Streptomyces sp. NPDC014734 TaxID=3364886 RepID=UPI0036F9102B
MRNSIGRGTVRNAVRRPWRRAVAGTVLAAAVLTGCSSESGDAGTGSSGDGAGSAKLSGERAERTGAAAGTGTGTAGKVAAKGGTVGGSGAACRLPVTFDLAASWKPKAVDVDPGSELGAALGVQGGITMVCEIDAKPAGHIGFLRVWKGEKSDRTPRRVLEAFMAEERGAEKVTYTEGTAGDQPATEVGYTVVSELLDEPKKERAFAVSTPDGPVVIHLGGLDTKEHEAMLPAYELARKSLRLG